jgi:hypothetical protein
MPICEFCGRYFVTMAELMAHIQIEHPEELQDMELEEEARELGF